jgi:hypothetical protein
MFITMLVISIMGCNLQTPSKVELALEKAGRNKKEIQKVIRHYKSTGEKQKLKAAYFLIGNMLEKVGIYYPSDACFFKLLPKVDSLRETDAGSDKIDGFIESEWTNIIREGCGQESLKSIPDLEIITAKYLISNIDLAFKVWKEKPWCKHLTFDEFCEWILPYRVNNEPLQEWRTFMYNELSWLQDSLKDPENVEDACLMVNDFLAKDFQFSHKLGFVPMLGGIDAWNNKQGLCEHRYQLIVMAMRSIGIPVSIDFTPYYPHEAGSHSWTVLLDKEGKIKTFNGGEEEIVMFNPPICPIGIKETVHVSTVYRYRYAVNEDALPENTKDKNLPGLFANKFLEEVSAEYTGVEQSGIEFDLSDKDIKSENIYLYTFTTGLNLTPVAHARNKNGKVLFKHIGRRGLYIPGFIKGNRIVLVGNPVDLPPGRNDIIQVVPDETKYQDVKLHRKFMVKYVMRGFIRDMQGARIQGANKKDFSDAETLFTIDTLVSFFDEFYLENSKPFRYYRYLATDSGAIRLAELSFLKVGKNGKEKINGSPFGYNADIESDDDFIVENAFDDNIRTNFNAPNSSWIAIDVGKQVKLHSFRLLPRNNLNIVEPGDAYELFYFKNGWIPIERKVAEDYNVDFSNVPLNAILLLKNLSKGQEERIFFYKNNKQIWR